MSKGAAAGDVLRLVSGDLNSWYVLVLAPFG